MNCITPYWVKSEKGVWDKLAKEFKLWLPVPCQKCPACLDRKVKQYTFMMEQEAKRSDNGYFVTLTYNDKKLPRYLCKNHGLVMHLVKKDLQDYFKRVREHMRRRKSPGHEELRLCNMRGIRVSRNARIDLKPMRYFACGEYGSINKRPHMHICVFNVFPVHLEHGWNDWGIVDIQPFNSNRAYYTAEYIMQSEDDRFNVECDCVDKNEKSFHVRSSFLGFSYIEDMKNWHLLCLRERGLVHLMSGAKVAMPKSFKKEIYSDLELLILRQKTFEEVSRLDSERNDRWIQKGYEVGEQLLSLHKAMFNEKEAIKRLKL